MQEIRIKKLWVLRATQHGKTMRRINWILRDLLPILQKEEDYISAMQIARKLNVCLDQGVVDIELALGYLCELHIIKSKRVSVKRKHAYKVSESVYRILPIETTLDRIEHGR